MTGLYWWIIDNLKGQESSNHFYKHRPTRFLLCTCLFSFSFVTGTRLPLGQTLNHASFDVYTPNTAETLIHGKCNGYCFLYNVWDIFSFGFIKALDSKGIRSCLLRQKRWSLAHWSQEFLGRKMKPQCSSKTLFSLQTHLGNICKCILVWKVNEKTFPGYFFFEVNKNLRIQITLSLRYAKNVIRNANCESIYHFPVDGYRT